MRLKMDNTTAVDYLNHMGGTQSQTLAAYAKQLWLWCLNRGITLSAEYLPREMNVTADFQSRALNGSAEWRLDPSVFQAILQILGPCMVDLFASRLNAQLEQYIIIIMEAGAIRNSDRCTTGAVDQPARVRFPSILPDRQVPAEGREGTDNSAADSSSVASPKMVSSSAGGIDRHTHTTSEITRPPHRPIRPATPTGQLPAIGRMRVSGRGSLQREYRAKLPNSSQQGGAKEQAPPTSQLGQSGSAGVCRGTWIPFRAM